MAWYQNDDGEWYSDEMLYSDTVNPNDVITYGPGDTYTAEDLVNPNNDFNYADFVDQPQTYRDSDFYEAYLNSGLDPTSSADVTAGMTPVELAALRGYMESQSNANTTGGGPGPATDYLASLVAAVKSGALTSEALKNLSAPVQTAVNKALAATPVAAPSFLDSIGNFLKTPTGQAVGVGGLAALLGSMGNRGVGEIYKGYQGGIPNYSASRTMNAIPTTTTDASGNVVARRPGQGGITYFSPMQYTAAGAATSNTPPSPAAGIAALPEANTASTAPAAGIAASSPTYSAPRPNSPPPNMAYAPPMAGPAPSAPPAGAPVTPPPMAGPAPSAPPAGAPVTPPPMAGPAPVPFDPMGQASLGVVVYGPDGKAYGSPDAARAAGVSNPTMSPPAGAPVTKAAGGLSSLGGYSAGGRGRLLRGPGDGVSDSIPAIIGRKQPARLADGEFVIPARVVSEIGNGSTEAGARKLYAMMDRVQKARGKTLKNVAANSRADKYLPA